MHAIKMKRLELLEIVKANKITHIANFLESVEDYKQVVLKLTTGNMKLAKTGNLEEFKKMKTLPSAPQSYESSYKKAIRMLELSIEDVIEVEEDVFNQLVEDEWAWSRNFSATMALYKSI